MGTSILDNLRNKYRLLILNDKTYEERLSFKLTRLNVFVVLGTSAILFITLTTLLISFTPLKYYIPGYGVKDLSVNQSTIPFSIIIIITASIVLIFFIILLFNYLKDEKENKVKQITDDILWQISHSLKRITEIDLQVKKSSFESIEDILDFIKNEIEVYSKKITGALVSDFLLTKDEKINRKLLFNAQYKNEIMDRFQLMINSFSKRANINLTIGVLITMLAFGGLGITLFQFSGDYQNNQTILNYFLPRFLILTFVQVFAFFFLKNYRANVDDIKFYQNEITNIELKALGLSQNFIEEGKEGNNEIILKALLMTERNFVLKKGQSEIGRRDNVRVESYAKDLLRLLEK